MKKFEYLGGAIGVDLHVGAYVSANDVQPSADDMLIVTDEDGAVYQLPTSTLRELDDVLLVEAAKTFGPDDSIFILGVTDSGALASMHNFPETPAATAALLRGISNTLMLLSKALQKHMEESDAKSFAAASLATVAVSSTAQLASSAIIRELSDAEEDGGEVILIPKQNDGIVRH